MLPFADKVYVVLKKIPRGKVTTYGTLATVIGHLGAARAVGNALNVNPHPITVPCHRVVQSNGKIGGYALGQRKKIALLRKEGVVVKGDRVDLARSLWHGKKTKKRKSK